LIIAAAVAVMAPLAGEVNPTTVALLLLLVILLIATAFGSRYALTASIAAALGFNFFFLPPHFTLHIADTENWVAFAAFVVTALVAGQLSTYAKRQAAESEKRRQKIEGLYEELQSAFEQASEAEALRRSEKLKSSLLDAITHDLRTPLTSIKASATTLLESKREALLDQEGEVELLEIIDEESDRLNGFIEGMVGLAQIESNAMHLRRSWTTVQDLFNTAVSRAGSALDSNHILMAIDRELPSVFVDARSVSEVLFLLLDNAAKYSPKGSTIKLAAHQTDGMIQITVEDQGKGIPDEAREKIFHKFVRLEENAGPASSAGMGLGLAIAKGVVESQGGIIRVDGGSNGYVTRFIVDLPIEEAETEV
jgi:two-component system sensor histidine kinase KdpD